MSEPLDLLPCPFCGKEASIGTVKWHSDTYAESMPDLGRTNGFYGHCMSCPCEMNILGVGQATRDLAVAAWNRRAPSPVGTAPVENFEALDLFCREGHQPIRFDHGETDSVCPLCRMNSEREWWAKKEPVGTAPLRDAISYEISVGHVAGEALGQIADRILALLPRSAPTLKGAPADDKA